jgi:dihydroorotate dehydrogenase (fumarate)
VTDLSTTYMGLRLENPIIVGSSGLTKSVERIKKCADAKAGAVVLKSLFEEQITAEIEDLLDKSQGGHWHPEAAEYIANYGHENAVDEYLETIRQSKKAVRIPVIASIHCVTGGAWTEFAARIEQSGADALELNVFVMPSDLRRSGNQNEQVYFDVVEAVKKKVSIPVALKIGFFFSSLAEMLGRLGKSGANALVLFNRFYNPSFDIENFKLKPSSIFSSPDEYLQSLRWISIASGTVGCDLAATTGIHTGETIVKQLLAGAKAVEICSALYKNGLDYIGTMLEELSRWMERHGFDSIHEFRGKMSQSKSSNPAEYERVQFMKTSLGME